MKKRFSCCSGLFGGTNCIVGCIRTTAMACASLPSFFCPRTADAHLSGRIAELALERRRFGYRRIWQLLRREGLHVNHKRV